MLPAIKALTQTLAQHVQTRSLCICHFMGTSLCIAQRRTHLEAGNIAFVTNCNAVRLRNSVTVTPAHIRQGSGRVGLDLPNCTEWKPLLRAGEQAAEPSLMYMAMSGATGDAPMRASSDALSRQSTSSARYPHMSTGNVVFKRKYLRRGSMIP